MTHVYARFFRVDMLPGTGYTYDHDVKWGFGLAACATMRKMPGGPIVFSSVKVQR